MTTPIQPMTISVCTTCHNRCFQLRRTFDRNLQDVMTDVAAEWIIVNYASRDNTHEYIASKLSTLPKQVVYVHYDGPREWHLSVAKNFAHRAASGKLLFNLDCDNLLMGTLSTLRSLVQKETELVHQWSGIPHDGTCGRVAVSRATFIALGGYDEDLFPMGYQDIDFLERAKASGMTIISSKCTAGAALTNDKTTSMKYCTSVQKTWDECNTANRMTSKSNIKSGYFTANKLRGWNAFHGNIWTGSVGNHPFPKLPSNLL